MLLQLLLLVVIIPFVLCYQWGSFDMLEDYTLTPETAFQQTVATSQCSCRATCIENCNCYAFGIELISPYRYACRLFNNTANMTIRSSSDGLVGSPYIEGATLESDGFYYFVAPMTLDINVIKSSCNVTLGKFQFRLALIKTKASFDVFAKYTSGPSSYYPVFDLEKNAAPDSKNATFGDGTPFQDSEIAKTMNLTNDDSYPAFYVLYEGNFNDVDWLRFPYYPFCQGNPLKLKI